MMNRALRRAKDAALLAELRRRLEEDLAAADPWLTFELATLLAEVAGRSKR